MNHRTEWLPLLAALLLVGCDDRLIREEAPEPTPERFSVCHGYGCREVVWLALEPGEWSRLHALFEPPAADAETERRRIGRAIALLEQWNGVRTGTDRDIGGTFTGTGRQGQMDCIDESTNTTTYLRMLRGEGLLRHHEVAERATRGYFIMGWPHTSAVIRESAGNRLYAVDSWFHGNGVEPEIVPLEQWRDGWDPGP